MRSSTRCGVRRAIVPAAGRGTRMRDIAGDRPKELLPVAGVPMLLYALTDLVLSGITEIAIVIAPDKGDIPRVLTKRFARADSEDPLAAWWRVLSGATFSFPVQMAPRGLADAVAGAAALVGDDPFVCALPDNIFAGSPPATATLLRTFAAVGAPTAALVRVPPDRGGEFGNCGAVELEELPEGRARITRLADKGSGPFTDPTGRGWRTAGLSVLTREYLEINATLPPNAAGEWDDVPILQRLARSGRLYGARLVHRCFDAGNPAGYRAANAAEDALPPPESCRV